MNRPWESEPRVDEKFLLQYAMLEEEGQPPILDVLIERFLSSAGGRFSDVTAAIRNRDFTLLQHSAHALKNVGGNVGLRRLSSLCNELEKRGEKETWADVEDLIQFASQELEAVRVALHLRSAQGKSV